MNPEYNVSKIVDPTDPTKSKVIKILRLPTSAAAVPDDKTLMLRTNSKIFFIRKPSATENGGGGAAHATYTPDACGKPNYCCRKLLRIPGAPVLSPAVESTTQNDLPPLVSKSAIDSMYERHLANMGISPPTQLAALNPSRKNLEYFQPFTLKCLILLKLMYQKILDWSGV